MEPADKKNKQENNEPKEKKEDNSKKTDPQTKKKEAPPRKENEFIIHYVLSPPNKRQEKYDKELKAYQKRVQMAEMMEEEMRKKMMESREGFELEMFKRFELNDKNRKEREKNDPRRKRLEEQKPVLNLNIEKLKLFGEHFVQSNKKKCKVIIENKEMELCEYYTTDSKEKTFKINESLNFYSYLCTR